MSGYSNERKALILDATMGGTAYSEAEENHLALVTVAVVGGDDGTTITEPTYTGYGRIPMLSTDWEPASLGEKINGTLMEFAECTAGEDDVIGWAHCTTAGTKTGLVICSGITPSFHVIPGRKPSFKPGALAYRIFDT